MDVWGGELEVYKVSLPRILKLVERLVEGCVARAKSLGILREYFMFRQWK